MLQSHRTALTVFLLTGASMLLTGCSSLPKEDLAYVIITEPPAETTIAGESTFETEPSTSATEMTAEPEPILLTDTDGAGKYYTFNCGGEEYRAVYTPDHWTIYDSCRITDQDTITRICEALRTEHPIHGADMASWRTAEDMAYEWMQHNLAYQLLPDDSEWKEHARDVDIDPKDQGKSMYDIYRERTGE